MRLFNKSLIIIATYLFELCIGRVYEIYTQDHLHDLYQDVKVGNRPATVIAFYNQGDCKNTLTSMGFGQSPQIPSIKHVMLAQYEMSLNRERIWFVYIQHTHSEIE